jgi:hypothetical protein
VTRKFWVATGCDLKRVQEFRETQSIAIKLILLVLDGAAGRESGESVSLLSRTPKARAFPQF